MSLHANCIYVSGPEDTLRAFFDAAEAMGEFSLASWMDEVDEDEEHPEGFGEPCVHRGDKTSGEEWWASWDSKGTYFESVMRTSEAWPTLRFDYYVRLLEGYPWFGKATYEGGNCTDSDDTEELEVARNWHEVFVDDVDDWAERLGEEGS